MPGLVKIGFTTKTVAERMAQLDTTGVPAPFACVYSAAVTDHEEVEETVHKELDGDRLGDKEFFEVSPEAAREVLSRHAIAEVDQGWRPPRLRAEPKA